MKGKRDKDTQTEKFSSKKSVHLQRARKRGGGCKEEEADSAGFLKFFHMLGDL